MGDWRFKILNALASIPHPTYGNYGGNMNVGHGAQPVDGLDEAFRTHDMTLDHERMLREIWKVRTSDMKRKIYGNAYRSAVTVIFWPLVKMRIL